MRVRLAVVVTGVFFENPLQEEKLWRFIAKNAEYGYRAGLPCPAIFAGRIESNSGLLVLLAVSELRSWMLSPPGQALCALGANLLPRRQCRRGIVKVTTARRQCVSLEDRDGSAVFFSRADGEPLLHAQHYFLKALAAKLDAGIGTVEEERMFWAGLASYRAHGERIRAARRRDGAVRETQHPMWAASLDLAG